MKDAIWWAIFVLIQVLNLVLTIPGLFICIPLAFINSNPKALRYCPWWNSDDGAVGTSWFGKYKWLAWRNRVANLRLIPGFSGKGRPLIYDWWTETPSDIKSGHYIKVGWESGPPYYPVFQPFASGRGY
jgi:hypothetical protein